MGHTRNMNCIDVFGLLTIVYELVNMITGWLRRGSSLSSNRTRIYLCSFFQDSFQTIIFPINLYAWLYTFRRIFISTNDRYFKYGQDFLYTAEHFGLLRSTNQARLLLRLCGHQLAWRTGLVRESHVITWTITVIPDLPSLDIGAKFMKYHPHSTILPSMFPPSLHCQPPPPPSGQLAQFLISRLGNPGRPPSQPELHGAMMPLYVAVQPWTRTQPSIRRNIVCPFSVHCLPISSSRFSFESASSTNN